MCIRLHIGDVLLLLCAGIILALLLLLHYYYDILLYGIIILTIRRLLFNWFAPPRKIRRYIFIYRRTPCCILCTHRDIYMT